MASRALFRIVMNKTQNFTAKAVFNVKAALYTTKPTSPIMRENLFARISPLGDPGVSLVPVLDQWVEEGRRVNHFELRHIVRTLRSSRRYSQALEVSQWMGKKTMVFEPGDWAVHLDLVGKVRGLDSAESYFSNLEDRYKDMKTYCALLHCYVREGLIDKSLSIVQKMRELNFPCDLLIYNNLMSLYTKTGQLEKVLDVFLEMKMNGVRPNVISYQCCIHSFGLRSDFDGMEKVLQEMEREACIFADSVDWNTYSLMANHYIKAGITEKAIFYLKKCEERVNGTKGYQFLISLYAKLGNKDEMMRLWGLQKANCKKQSNKDYIKFLGCLMKFGELEEAEKLLKEWEFSCENFDFRVPNVLLIGYSQKGLVEKAEELLWDILRRQKTAAPNSWSILATGYAEKNNMVKAFECFKEALAEPARAQNQRWRPKPHLIADILSWLGDNADVEDVEAFVELLKSKVPPNREMYHALIKAYKRAGRDLDRVLERMNADGVDQDEETGKILDLQEATCI